MNQLGGYEFADLRIGMSATFAKTITEADIVLVAAVSGDNMLCISTPNTRQRPSSRPVSPTACFRQA
jgi:hypothetical protein